MADSTTPTDSTAGDPKRFVLSASINAAGELVLSGKGLRENTIEVDAGDDVVLRIADIEGLYVYGEEIVPGGGRSLSWGRSDKGMARRKFSAVSAPVNSIVYAVSSADTSKIKYGPVITVKPKG